MGDKGYLEGGSLEYFFGGEDFFFQGFVKGSVREHPGGSYMYGKDGHWECSGGEVSCVASFISYNTRDGTGKNMPYSVWPFGMKGRKELEKKCGRDRFDFHRCY